MFNAIRWAALNFSIVGAFLYGTIYNIEGFLNIGVFMLWFTAIIGLLLFSKDSAKRMLEDKPNWTPSVSPWVDVTFDVIVLGMLLFYGYIWLSAFYLIHIYGLMEFRKNIKLIKKELEDV